MRSAEKTRYLRTEWVQEEEDLADTERWENDWDDDDVSDDFSKQLKEELEKVMK